MHSSKRINQNKFMHCHASNIHLLTNKNQTSCKSMSYLCILQHDGIILVTLSRDLMKINDPLMHGLKFRQMTLCFKASNSRNDPLMYGFKFRFMTL